MGLIFICPRFLQEKSKFLLKLDSSHCNTAELNYGSSHHFTSSSHLLLWQSGQRKSCPGLRIQKFPLDSPSWSSNSHRRNHWLQLELFTVFLPANSFSFPTVTLSSYIWEHLVLLVTALPSHISISPSTLAFLELNISCQVQSSPRRRIWHA